MDGFMLVLALHNLALMLYDTCVRICVNVPNHADRDSDPLSNRDHVATV